jgi:hypothetical protein
MRSRPTSIWICAISRSWLRRSNRVRQGPAGLSRRVRVKIYSTIQWGQLANFRMMDTPQYRNDQLAGRAGRRTCWTPGRGPHHHGRRAGEMAAGRLQELRPALGDPRPAAVLRRAGQEPGAGDRRRLHGRVVLAGRSRHGFCPQSFMIRIFYICQTALGAVSLGVWSAFRAR